MGELQTLYDELWLGWHCDCGCYNEDSFLETARPVCADCYTDYAWDDIITPEEMELANRMLDRVQQLEEALEKEATSETTRNCGR